MASNSSSSELYIIVGGSDRRIGGIWFVSKLLLFAEAAGVAVEGDCDEDCEPDSDITEAKVNLLRCDSFGGMAMYGRTSRARGLCG